MRRQSRPFVVEVKRTRKAPTNIWGSSSIFDDAEAPTNRAGAASASLEGLFKKSPTQAPEQAGNTSATPRILPSLLADETPVLERAATSDHVEEDDHGIEDDVFSLRTPSPAARKISAKAKAPARSQAVALPDLAARMAPPAEPAPAAASLWDDPRSREAFAEDAKPLSSEDATAALGWSIKPKAEEVVASLVEPKLSVDLFAGQLPPEEIAPSKPKANSRRKAQTAVPKVPKAPLAFSLPLDDEGEDDEILDADEVLDAVDAAHDIQPLADAAPRRDVNASVVRRRRKQPAAALPPGQRWKRRLPSSLR
ncbi:MULTISPECIES: hypothetical protein [unclassified Chelatococcus]|jgi:hypothetical protein|uniref:hypothetical protein n=1 Tax=unclassified Chelatococcus TaxID=2638111 RepID=UPI001BCBD176|nr:MULTISPECIES: hypothetical protein [unclassified Chelatococcus]CAH1657652.1 conserved hypothetical protein [Hyphomicrobiales bacterium]MBS7740708.1 hypothetical protein [Chelatococcus sp. HY11]MBX3546058.1 hypothetical protein [Chelatococcus sp.]MCO5079807.1 hypothetical protein [Chelatococcus sp.]CAH1684364.1 conserved hypothetical protein [Hyphomicrobiales bacterium]